MADQPRLTVRAMAEMLRLPALAQMRILAGQKYPKEEPQVFRTPYYQPALTGIRNYYKSGNSESELAAALSKIQSISQKPKRTNNARALESFCKNAAANRFFTLLPNTSLHWTVGSVQLRLSPDLQVKEKDEHKFIFFNLRAEALDNEDAIRTVEIAHLVAEKNNLKIPISNIEYLDLRSGKRYRTKKRRASTTKAVSANAQPIAALWASL